MIVLFLLPATCLAAPWSYELPIGDGYSIVVSTTMSVLCAKDRRVVLDPGGYDGPRIDRYATTQRHIFVRTYTGFFILDKRDDSVIGPLSGADFERHPIVLASGPLHWRQPHQPYGDTLFFLLLILMNPAFGLGIALVLLLIVATLSLAYRRLRSERRVLSH